MIRQPRFFGGSEKMNFFKKLLDFGKMYVIIHFVVASVAHLVERHLAKVEVASSSLVTRSKIPNAKAFGNFFISATKKQ